MAPVATYPNEAFIGFRIYQIRLGSSPRDGTAAVANVETPAIAGGGRRRSPRISLAFIGERDIADGGPWRRNMGPMERQGSNGRDNAAA